MPGLESGHFERAFSGSRRIRRSLWSCGCLLFHLAKSDPRAPQRRAKLTDVFRSRDRQTRSASGTIPRPRDGDAIPPSAGCVSRRTATRSPRTRGAIRGGRITPSLRAAGFEDEDENEAPGEQPQPATRVQLAAGAILQHSTTPPSPTYRGRGRRRARGRF